MDLKPPLILKRLGIDTYKEPVVYLHSDNAICQSEGYEAQAQVRVECGGQWIIATLNMIHSDLLKINEVSLSEYAWKLLQAEEGEEVSFSHPKTLESLSFIHSKIYGHELDAEALNTIIQDALQGYLSNIQIAAFLTACAGGRLNLSEITALTEAMINAGDRLQWPQKIVVDKHCIGGLPGNRTTLIIVPIVAAFGLTIPKTSSRAITSPAGTADTMEVFTAVDLTTEAMKQVVEKEGGCIVWGGSVSLSPVDDILIRVERGLDLDSEGQMVASVLSKKIAAGSNHVLIDIPLGSSAKVRTPEMANCLKNYLEEVAARLDIKLRVVISHGEQPVGRGIGPVLEALDVMAVLQNDPAAPQDLRAHALSLAAELIEFSPEVNPGEGKAIAEKILASGEAWKKFQAICQAQGGMKFPQKARYFKAMLAHQAGKITRIDNRRLARIAKLAGAPHSKAAGVEILASIGDRVVKDQVLFNIYSESLNQLNYAVDYVETHPEIIFIGASE